jgi:hypothetical protein
LAKKGWGNQEEQRTVKANEWKMIDAMHKAAADGKAPEILFYEKTYGKESKRNAYKG